MKDQRINYAILPWLFGFTILALIAYKVIPAFLALPHGL
jgi:hypothetical protein